MGNTPAERELRRESAEMFRCAQDASRRGDFESSRLFYGRSDAAETALGDIEEARWATPWTAEDHTEERSWGSVDQRRDLTDDETDAAC